MKKANFDNYLNFDETDFLCRCGCGKSDVDEAFLDKLQDARTNAGIPFVLTSGCRCRRYNNLLVDDPDVGASPNSLHVSDVNQLCTAADISANTDKKRATILVALVKAGFTHMGIHSVFIHVDNSKKKGVWLYK